MAVGYAAAAMVVGGLVRQTAYRPSPPMPATEYQVRRTLFRELQPVKLANCALERFGEANDGGYLLCGNLLTRVGAAYSYGISGYDGWGCDVSRRLGVTVHQYDCFVPIRPICEGGSTVFHDECVGPAATVEEGRPFDTIAGQIAKNGDKKQHVVMKMDVEGAEWESFLAAPDEVLQRIDQLAVEFHGHDQPRYLEALRKLKRFFHVAHIHWNNNACIRNAPPFPAWAYEVLFVNKRIAAVDPGGVPVLPHPLDTPNRPDAPDCQATP